MKLIFAGTPEFAGTILEALINDGHEICAVLCQADKPTGRGQKTQAPQTKRIALRNNIPVWQPLSLKDPEMQHNLSLLSADLMIVAVYGLLLPKEVLNIPRLGCLNVHASLLPRWRGASPIHQAILAGDTKTGVTLMKMDIGLDTGDMLAESEIIISPEDTTATLHNRLAIEGAALLSRYLKTNDLKNIKTLLGTPQPTEGVTYAPKIKKSDAHIDWQNSAELIERQIRAYQPWPICFSELEGKIIRFWNADCINDISTQNPGSILRCSSDGIDIATGQGILRTKKLQLPGKKPLSIKDILNGHQNIFEVGKQFVINTRNL